MIPCSAVPSIGTHTALLYYSSHPWYCSRHCRITRSQMAQLVSKLLLYVAALYLALPLYA